MKSAGPFRNLTTIKPIIVMSYELRMQIMAFVNGINWNECQWFHTIERTIDKNTVTYNLRYMLIPEQEVTGATVESPEKGMLSIWNELKANHTNEDGTYDKQAVNNIIGSMHAWCHSHVNMPVNPSGTDETTFRQWIENNNQQDLSIPAIMMIVNKKEDVYIRLYDPELNIYCENPDIQIAMPFVDTTDIEAAIKNKVKSKSYYNSVSKDIPRVWSGSSSFQAPRNTSVDVQTSLWKEKEVLADESLYARPKIVASNTMNSVPTIVMSGKSLLGAKADSIEDDLRTIATKTKCTEEVVRVLSALSTALPVDEQLYIFSLLLEKDKNKICDLVLRKKDASIPKTEDILTELYSYLSAYWMEHPYVFYAILQTAKSLTSITGKEQKRLREVNILLQQLEEISSQYSRKEHTLSK